MADKLTKISADLLQDIIAHMGGGSPTTFLGLTDTPSSYAGAGGYYVKVNSGATGLEFSAAGGSTTFVSLTDTPSSYTAAAYKMLRVNTGQTGVEFATLQGTTNQVTVTHAADLITLSLPQNIHTSASPTFANVFARLYRSVDSDWNDLVEGRVYSATASHYPYILLRRARGTEASPADIQASDYVGCFSGQGRVNGAWQYVGSASWRALSVGTTYPSGFFAIAPARSSDGATTEVLRAYYEYVTVDGNFGIGQATFGTSATKTLAIGSGAAPETSPVDAIQLYSSDFAAGNACPTFRTENGTVIQLNQNLTTYASPTFIALTLNGKLSAAAVTGTTAEYTDSHRLDFTLTASSISASVQVPCMWLNYVWANQAVSVSGGVTYSPSYFHGRQDVYSQISNSGTIDAAGFRSELYLQAASTGVITSFTDFYAHGPDYKHASSTATITDWAGLRVANPAANILTNAYGIYVGNITAGSSVNYSIYVSGGTSYFGGVVRCSSYLEVAEIAAPGTPGSGYGRIYGASDGKVYYVNDAGTTYDLTSTGGSAHAILSSTHSDTLTATVVRGDIIVGNSTPAWARLAIGSNGYFLKSNGTDAAWAAHGLTYTDVGAPPDTRSISTTAPLSGGGNLTADRTLTLAGLSSLGTANYLVGVNSGATGWEYKQLIQTANRVTVSHGAGAITLSGPQDIHTAATPQFARVGLGVAASDSKGLALTGTVDPATDATCYGIQVYSLSLTPGTSYDAYFGSFAGTVVAGVGETIGSAYGIAQSGMTKSGSGTITTAYGIYSSSPALATTNWNFYASGAAGSYFGGFVRHASYLEVAEIAAPGTPGSGYGRLYGASDGKIYYVNDGGTSFDLTLGGGAVGAHNFLDSTVHNNTLTGTPTRGDIIYANSTPAWAKLGKGTDGYFLKSNSTDVVWAAHGLTASDVGAVPTSRTISTTTPLAGGGDLTTNRTLTVGGLSAWGSANQLVGMNNAAGAWEYKTIQGTTDQVAVAHAANLITLSTPQNIATTSAPQFARIGLGVASSTAYQLYQAGTLTGSANYRGIYQNQTFTLSAAGTYVDGVYIGFTVDTTVNNYSLGGAYGLRVGALSKSGSGTITDAYGLHVTAPTIGSSNNYGIYTTGLFWVQDGVISGGGTTYIYCPTYTMFPYQTTPTTPATGVKVYSKSDGLVYYLNTGGVERAFAMAARSISTTSPLSGGGDLSADRTISLAGLTGLGSANQLLGMNNGATAYEYKSLNGTTNQVTVTHATNSITLSLPQSIHTGASPQFTNETLTGYLDIAEQTAPATPGSGYGRLYFKTDGYFYAKNDAGTESQITGVSAGGGKLKSQAFTSDGTWTQPSGVTLVWVTAVGGGGGGEAGITSTRGGGGGGGGAFYYRFPVTVSGNVSVTIGTAGTAGSGSSGANGGSGGSTTFGSYLTAHGGIGGGVAGSGYGGAGGGEVGFGATQTTAGSAGNSPTIRGSFYIPGAGGGAGTTTSPTSGGAGAYQVRYGGGSGGASTYGGGGGAGAMGTGGTGGTSGVAGTAGSANTGAGGGGGWGGATYTAGGAGGTGWLLVEWVE
jgi:hypothetical protein